MKSYLFFTLCILFFSCSTKTSENAAQQNDSLAHSISKKDSVKSADRHKAVTAEPDSLKIAKLKFYAATWDASYFPLPSAALLLTYSDEDPFYNYLIENFDTISTRIATQNYESRGAETENP